MCMRMYKVLLCFSYMDVSAPHSCLVPEVARRGGSDSLKLESQIVVGYHVGAAGSSARVVSTLNHRAISPAPIMIILLKFDIIHLFISY